MDDANKAAVDATKQAGKIAMDVAKKTAEFVKEAVTGKSQEKGQGTFTPPSQAKNQGQSM